MDTLGPSSELRSFTGIYAYLLVHTGPSWLGPWTTNSRLKSQAIGLQKQEGSLGTSGVILPKVNFKGFPKSLNSAMNTQLQEGTFNDLIGTIKS